MRPSVVFLAILSLAACSAQKPPSPAKAAIAGQTASIPLTPAAPASPLAADEDPAVQTGAWVVRLDEVAHQGDMTVKLYGMAGGDPAMNGLRTYLAFYLSPADGWKVFAVGDLLDYRILAETPGRVDLEIQESVLDPETTVISSRKRRVILAWTSPSDGGAPTNVSVAPAR